MAGINIGRRRVLWWVGECGRWEETRGAAVGSQQDAGETENGADEWLQETAAAHWRAQATEGPAGFDCIYPRSIVARVHYGQTLTLTLTLTYIHPFNGPLSGTTRVSQYQKGKTVWILLKQETVSGSGISWAICKSAPSCRQITTPAPHHLVFFRLDALPAAQPTASKHWRH